MSSLRFFAILCFMLAAIIYPSYADIYKWKDSEGKLRYSDIPPRSDTQYEVINKKNVSKGSGANLASTNPVKTGLIAENKSDSKNTKGEASLEGKKNDKLKDSAEKTKNMPEAQTAENNTIDEENCKAAKSNFAVYNNGGRIKRINEKGESVFLSDAEILNAKEGAQKDLDKYCHG